MTKIGFRFEQGGKTGIGTLDGDTIAVILANFPGAEAYREKAEAQPSPVLTPCAPSKMIACVYFHQLAPRTISPEEPQDPLWFEGPLPYWPSTGRSAPRPIPERSSMKANSASSRQENASISRPKRHYIFFCYTCVNDVTAGALCARDSRSNMGSFEKLRHLGVFGVPSRHRARSHESVDQDLLNGRSAELSVADSFFPPHKLVTAILSKGRHTDEMDSKAQSIP